MFCFALRADKQTQIEIEIELDAARIPWPFDWTV